MDAKEQMELIMKLARMEVNRTFIVEFDDIKVTLEPFQYTFVDCGATLFNNTIKTQ